MAEILRKGWGTFPVPGTDRAIRLPWETVYDIEGLFYAPIIPGQRLSDLGHFEPAFYVQGSYRANLRAFSVHPDSKALIANPGVSPQFSRNMLDRLNPEKVVLANTKPDRLPDILNAAAQAIFKESRGDASYRWDWQFVIERQTDHKYYEDANLPGPGWVCIRRASALAIDNALERGSMPTAAGMAPWSIVPRHTFGTTPFREQKVAPIEKGREKRSALLGLKVGEAITIPFPGRRAVYGTLQVVRGLAGDVRQFRVEDDCAEPGQYVITRLS